MKPMPHTLRNPTAGQIRIAGKSHVGHEMGRSRDPKTKESSQFLEEPTEDMDPEQRPQRHQKL